jgi:hypothetical protein
MGLEIYPAAGFEMQLWSGVHKLFSGLTGDDLEQIASF